MPATGRPARRGLRLVAGQMPDPRGWFVCRLSTAQATQTFGHHSRPPCTVLQPSWKALWTSAAGVSHGAPIALRTDSRTRIQERYKSEHCLTPRSARSRPPRGAQGLRLDFFTADGLGPCQVRPRSEPLVLNAQCRTQKRRSTTFVLQAGAPQRICTACCCCAPYTIRT